MREKAGIRAVFFDVDDTLYNQSLVACKAMRKVIGELPADDHEIYLCFRQNSERMSSRTGLLEASVQAPDAVKMREQRFSMTLDSFGVSISERQAAAMQKEYTALQQQLVPFDGAAELFRKLSRMGLKTGFITNGNKEHQWSKLYTLGAADWVPRERIFVSGEAGYTKPDKAIFQYANQRTGTVPEECVYIGDSWTNDIQGAKNAGWKAVWFNYLGLTMPDSGGESALIGEVRSYAELDSLFTQDWIERH